MALVEKHCRTTDLTYWRDRIPVNFLYTAGRAGERFFRAMMGGRLLAARCDSCGKAYLPPRIYCERCFERLEDKFVEVPARGRVLTWTVCYKNHSGAPLVRPVIVAFVRIDGTDGGLIHYLGEIEPNEVSFDMPVEAVFVPEDERKGTILDIKYFRKKAEKKD